jgi:diguanylate cyclase (GGDEF)-like protein/PAS domain S-box-containing protein
MTPPINQPARRGKRLAKKSPADGGDGGERVETGVVELASKRAAGPGWKEVLGGCGHPLMVADGSGVVFANPRARSLLGETEASATPPADLLHGCLAPEQASAVQIAIEAVLQERTPRRLRLQLDSGDAGKRAVEAHISALSWSSTPAALLEVDDLTTAESLAAALERAEHRYRSLARDGHEWFWETDATHRFVHCSYLPEQEGLPEHGGGVLGKSRFEIADTSRDPDMWERHRRDLAAHRPFENLEYQLDVEVPRTHSRPWVRVKGTPHYDRDGHFLGYRGVGTDITDEVETRAQTVRLESTLADVVQSLPVAFALFDAEERLHIFNDRYLTLQGPDVAPHINVGMTFEEVLQLHLQQGTFMEAADRRQAFLSKRLAEFRRGDTVRLLQRRDGWHQINDRRLADGSTVVICTDITELKQQEAALEETRSRLADYATASGDWFWESDEDHRLTYISDRFRTLTGVDPASFIGRFRGEVPGTSSGSAALEAHLDDLRHRRPFRDFRYTIRCEDGRILTVSTNGLPVFRADGSFAGYRGSAVDISDSIQAKTNQERFLAAIESISDGYSLWDSDDRLVVFNSVWKDFVSPGTSLTVEAGLDHESLVRDSLAAGAYPEAADDPEEWVARRQRMHRQDGNVFEMERHPGVWYLVRERRTEDGGVVQTASDISALKRREQALRESEERFKSFAESAADWLWELDADACFTFVSSRFERVTGLHASTLMGRPFETLAAETDSSKQVLHNAVQTMRGGNGVSAVEFYAATRGVAISVQSLSGDAVRGADGTTIVGFRGTCRDVTQARLMSMQLAYQASHDELTGLVNRRGFEQRLSQTREIPGAEGGSHSLCYLDLDQFKVVNDTCGHAAGDELLQRLAGVLQEKVRGRDTVARLGGDEFAVLLENCPVDEACRIAEGLRAAIEGFEFEWEDKRFRLGASLGVVCIRPGSTISELMREADNACYVAKEQGRNRVHVHGEDENVLNRRQDELNWVARLNQALSDRRLVLYGQRILPCSGGAATSHMEVLIRLRGEDGELIAPGRFLPAAERYGIATRIDRWVVQTCFDLLRARAGESSMPGFLSINLSGQSLGDRDFCEFVLRQLADGVPGDRICFEVTETAAIADLTAAEHFIQSTREHGCRFALDDFGTGLSSFAYLRDLAVDFVKIDGAFIKELESDPISLAMVRSIHQVASVLGKRTIAEYVSNERVVQMLAEVGIDYVQGFGVGRPAPIDTLLR